MGLLDKAKGSVEKAKEVSLDLVSAENLASMKESVAELIRPLHMTPKRHSKYLVGLAKLGYVVYI